MKACACGKPLDARNRTGLCQWCYLRWRFRQSSLQGRKPGRRKLKTILKGLP